MLQRGRKTAASVTALPFSRDRSRLQPPPHLSDAERRLFVEVVANCPPQQFAPADALLLASYVQATLLSRASVKKAARDPRMLAVWEKSTRMAATLATRLRLSPQSRVDPKVIGRHQLQQPVSAYQLMMRGDDE